MDPKKVLQNLQFRKEVSSKRQTYYVYENDVDFVLMTANANKANSFNFSIISKDAVAAVQKKFKGRTVTSSDVLDELRKPVYVKSSFDALNTMYALCASGGARIDHRFKDRSIHFSIRPV